MIIWLQRALVLVLFTFLVLLVHYAFGNVEKTFCYDWQKQAKELRDYYISQSQAHMCDAHGITIDAPIK